MKNLYSPLFALAFLLFQFSTVFAQSAVNAEAAGISTERLDRYAGFIQQEIEAGRIPGAVCLTLRKGHIAHQAAYGYSNIAEKTPMRQDQIFFIQSMTKPIVSVAFMMLYEEGHFQLTDPVSEYLPQFEDRMVAKDKEAGKESETITAETPITITHLLSHTAGFSHGIGGSQLDKDYARQLYNQPHENLESRVNAMLELPLLGEPGRQWYYSASPDVLALLIEHFSGMSTAEFLQKRLFDPLGMKDTGYNLPESKKARVVSLHYKNKEDELVLSPRQTQTEGNKVFGGTHGLFSTAADYMKFCTMLLHNGKYNGKQFLSRKTVELMTLNHTGHLYNRPGHGFGLGFAILEDVADAQRLGSEGQYFWSGAYNTYFFIDPKEEMITIFMTQLASYTDYYANKMRQFVYQAIVD